MTASRRMSSMGEVQLGLRAAHEADLDQPAADRERRQVLRR